MMQYDKNKTLEFLKNPYQKIGGFRSPVRRKVASFLHGLTRDNLNRHVSDLVWSKTCFKAFLTKAIRMPESFFFADELEPLKVYLEIGAPTTFVWKPNHLSQGVGVRVLMREGKLFKDISGEELTVQDLLDEAALLMELRKGPCASNAGILIEERIFPHEAFAPFIEVEGAIADVRFLFLVGDLKCTYARFPTRESNGYGNYSRGAVFGATLDDGVFCNDSRFSLQSDIEGRLPFFEEMRAVGREVVRRCQLPWQAVDMTVNAKGQVVVIESESFPQIICLSDEGVQWIWDSLVNRHKATVLADS
jgi:hypothetical protein